MKAFCEHFIKPVKDEKITNEIKESFKKQLDISSINEQKLDSTLVTKSTFMQDFSTGKGNPIFNYSDIYSYT